MFKHFDKFNNFKVLLTFLFVFQKDKNLFFLYLFPVNCFLSPNGFLEDVLPSNLFFKSIEFIPLVLCCLFFAFFILMPVMN